MRRPRYGGVQCSNLADAAILGRRSPTLPRTPTPPQTPPWPSPLATTSRGLGRAAEATTGGLEVAVAAERLNPG